jgi:transposase-like protein
MRKRHSQSFKDQAVEKALNRSSDETLGQIADQYGIGYSTLTRWMHQVKQGNLTDQLSGTAAKEPRPQDWAPEQKLQAVIDTQGLNEQDKGRYCREHGVYHHQIDHWKQQFMSHTNDHKQSQTDKAQIKALKAENKRLQRELARKEKALAEAAALMVLKKKAQALFGSDEED